MGLWRFADLPLRAKKNVNRIQDRLALLVSKPYMWNHEDEIHKKTFCTRTIKKHRSIHSILANTTETSDMIWLPSPILLFVALTCIGYIRQLLPSVVNTFAVFQRNTFTVVNKEATIPNISFQVNLIGRFSRNELASRKLKTLIWIMVGKPFYC